MPYYEQNFPDKHKEEWIIWLKMTGQMHSFGDFFFLKF